jgi:hypothetical protein
MGVQQFTVEFVCLTCAQVGVAGWEEAYCRERPFHAKRNMIFLSRGFHQGDGKTLSGDPEIVCDRCDSVLPDRRVVNIPPACDHHLALRVA